MRKRPRDQSEPLVAAVASSKGKKLVCEDVPIICPTLGDCEELSLYAILDGHGGRDCADWVCARLPSILAESLASATESKDIKSAIKSAFESCDAELLKQCEAKDWDDGTCVVALLVDRRCSPARGYVANLGDSRAYVAVVPQAAGYSGEPSRKVIHSAQTSESAIKAVSLSKEHSAIEPKERKRIEAAGGFVENGRACGVLQVSRSLGDRRLKKGGSACPKGLDISSSTPDVTSFDIDPTLQRFALLGCDGLWTAFAGLQAVEWLNERLPKMDSRRTEIAKTLDEPASASALTQAELAALKAERESACEEGLLKAMLHEAVHVRHAKDNVTAVLVRLPEL